MAKFAIRFVFIAAAVSVFACNLARASWPAHVFAPYMYLGSGDNFKLTDCDDACGLKYYTLAFIIADKEGNPAWDGRTPMDKDLYHDQIDAIRQRGGDLLISFGGAAGKDLALVETDLAKLEAKYQSVIDRYKFTWLDFDIEGKQLEDDAANQRRNTVLAALQKKNPGLLISFTLPVDPSGISKHSQDMLKDAAEKGVKIKSANVMTMYFGPKAFKDKTMTELCEVSVDKAYEQCQKIDPAIEIGITPMIGKGGDKGAELFSLDDAKAIQEWASTKPWVCSIGFWSVNRDSGKPSRRGEQFRMEISADDKKVLEKRISGSNVPLTAEVDVDSPKKLTIKVESTGNDGGNTASGIEQKPFDYSKVLQKFTTAK